jgi:hypothetical protein
MEQLIPELIIVPDCFVNRRVGPAQFQNVDWLLQPHQANMAHKLQWQRKQIHDSLILGMKQETKESKRKEKKKKNAIFTTAKSCNSKIDSFFLMISFSVRFIDHHSPTDGFLDLLLIQVSMKRKLDRIRN